MRGVVASPANVVVTCGYSQGLAIVCHALAAAGAKRIALEDPTWPEQVQIAARAGLEPVPVPVDDAGIRVDELERADADAVILTPAHQHPTGVVLTGERRTQLLAWLRDRDAIAIEDDYDAEYRYDRAAVGALQGLEPDRVVYAGSVSKTLAPALRIGWLVVPPALLEAVTEEKVLADRGTGRIEQQAFADFVTRGELDRHLRRMRARYRARRDALIEAVAEELPEATVGGIAAGLHALVELPEGDDEQAIRDETAPPSHRARDDERLLAGARRRRRRRSCSATRRCPSRRSEPASGSWRRPCGRLAARAPTARRRPRPCAPDGAACRASGPTRGAGAAGSRG